jgi:hypothetical protein
MPATTTEAAGFTPDSTLASAAATVETVAAASTSAAYTASTAITPSIASLGSTSTGVSPALFTGAASKQSSHLGYGVLAGAFGLVALVV